MPTASVDGVELWYREAGEGPPVLLIHGMGINADFWRSIPDDLATDHRVIVYDRRGTTRSRDAGAVADWARHGDDAAALLESLDAAPAIVVGWSAGAVVAADLAVRHPQLVRSLVFIEPGLFGRKNLTPAAVGQFARMKLLWRLGRRERALEGYFRWVVSRRSGPSLWDDPDFPQERKDAMIANGETMMTEIDARDAYLLDRVGTIDVPVRILVGDDSPTWFERIARHLAERMPRAELEVVPGMSHSAAVTAPAKVVAAIRYAASADQITSNAARSSGTSQTSATSPSAMR